MVVAGITRDAQRRARQHDAGVAAADTTIMGHGLVQGTVRRVLLPAGQKPAVAPEEMRRRVNALAQGTYIADVLAEQDSALYRWPERTTNALRVWIEPTSMVPGFEPSYVQDSRTVFDEWSQAGFPLRFTFVYDSTGADITIHWVERFPPEDGQRIGVTTRVQNSAFEIARADVAIANHDSTGRQLTPRTVGGIIRHEVGHALGLNHAADQTSVMYRQSATSEIAASDRATLRLIYLVPGGSLK